MVKGLLIFLTLLATICNTWQRSQLMLRKKIVGGQAVSICQRPFQVSLLARGNHVCGGVIISSEWIVTAAHCLHSRKARTISIRAGSSLHYSGGQIARAALFTIHPSYNGTVQYDIAVLRLSIDLNLSLEVQPITLPEVGSYWAGGTNATLSGWGLHKEGGPLSKTLHAVSIPIVSKEECRKLYNESDEITDGMLCAGLIEGGKDACSEDSGGPLTVSDPPVLAGIVSWGHGCGKMPGIYSHVGYFRSFISEATGGV